MTLTNLEKVTPGKRLGSLRYGSGGVIGEAELSAGVLPDDSEADKAFVIKNDMDKAIGKVALEIGDDSAEIIFAVDGADPQLIRRLVGEAMSRSDVSMATVEVEQVDQTPATMEAAGFQPDASGDTYIFAGA